MQWIGQRGAIDIADRLYVLCRHMSHAEYVFHSRLDSCESAQVAEACLSGMVLDEQVHFRTIHCSIHPFVYLEATLSPRHVKKLCVLGCQVIKVQRDWGWTPGRQFGRAANGGQIRDLFRKGYNPHRGGWVQPGCALSRCVCAMSVCV